MNIYDKKVILKHTELKIGCPTQTATAATLVNNLHTRFLTYTLRFIQYKFNTSNFIIRIYPYLTLIKG